LRWRIRTTESIESTGYVAAGYTGISLSLHATPNWLTRGTQSLETPRIIAEEAAYVARPDPNHEALQRAREALELDFVAFDYGYDRDGQVVVWETNPYPTIHLRKSPPMRPAAKRMSE